METWYDDSRRNNDRPAIPRRRLSPVHRHSDDEVKPVSKSMTILEPDSRRRAPSPPDLVRRFSFPDRRTTRPRTPQPPYPRDPTGYLSPPDDYRYNSAYPNRSPRIKYPTGKSSSPVQLLRPVKMIRDYEYCQPISVARTILPEDKRSAASQARLERRAWSNSPAAPSSLTSRPLSSVSPSGVLGDKAYLYTELRWMEFRLVKILPARMSTIKCEIIHDSLLDPLSYVAVSYTWGDADDTRKIQLEGSSVPITSSLYGALEALRQKAEPVLVWADALCIDQKNIDEQTQQVRLMTSIYSKAESVAIWLGPETDDSSLAIDFLIAVADRADSPESITRLISSRVGRRDFPAVVSLFERDYWRRLWVVQEIFNAKAITVYCGRVKLPWDVFKLASHTFRRHKGDLDYYFPGGTSDGKRYIVSQNQLAYSQVLVHQGPGSLSGLRSLMGLGEGSLLEALRACRRKLAADPRDKVFGILGILTGEVRREFPANYSLSVKEVYTNVVDYLLATTERLDVICEAIYFPLHTSSTKLPTWVPDWSHIPQTAALGLSYDFSAAGSTKADIRLIDDRRNKLEISAIYLDTIRSHGIAVGTLCALADFLMAFLHWRALLLASHNMQEEENNLLLQEAFARTLCLDQMPSKWDKPRQWLTVCYHLFASLIHDRLPYLPLDRELQSYVNVNVNINPDVRRRILYEHCSVYMMGRCFCLTKEGRMGMGSGFMAPDDIVVIPLGCYTPIILRSAGNCGEYRFVGDVYINGYMYGKAVDQWRDGRRDLKKYVLH